MWIPQSSSSSSIAVLRSSSLSPPSQPEPQLVRIFTVEATAAHLPVHRVHGGGNSMEILPAVVAAAPDTAAREGLAENALPPAEGRHHAAIPSVLILGERRTDLRQAHHPYELAAVHRTPLPLARTSFGMRFAPRVCPARRRFSRSRINRGRKTRFRCDLGKRFLGGRGTVVGPQSAGSPPRGRASLYQLGLRQRRTGPSRRRVPSPCDRPQWCGHARGAPPGCCPPDRRGPAGTQRRGVSI